MKYYHANSKISARNFITREEVTLLVYEDNTCGTTWGNSRSSLPVLSVIAKTCIAEVKDRTPSIVAAPSHVVHVISALVARQKWKSIVCIYEDDSGKFYQNVLTIKKFIVLKSCTSSQHLTDIYFA